MIPEEDEGSETYVEHTTRYAFAGQFVRGKTVLDIACGSGYGAQSLLDAGARRVIGVDISPEAVEDARRRCAQGATRIVRGDLKQIPLSARAVDVVVSFETIEHVGADGQKTLLEEVRRVLRPGGLFIVSTPNALTFPHYYRSPFHRHELTPTEFSALLEGSFRNVTYWAQDTVTASYVITSEASSATDRREVGVDGAGPREVLDSLFIVAIGTDGPSPDARGRVSLASVKPRDSIRQCEHVISQQASEMARLQAEVARLEERIRQIQSDRDRRLINRLIFQCENLVDRIRRSASSRSSEAADLVRKAAALYRREGLSVFLQTLGRYVRYGRAMARKGIAEDRVAAYKSWIRLNEAYRASDVRRAIRGMPTQPKISILTPVYNVDPLWLNRCIQSVRGQSYGNWELCLYDDASTRGETCACLQKWAVIDPRIKVVFGTTNRGVAGASNGALTVATGDYAALLDHDDTLAPFALYEIAAYLNEHPRVKYLYTDEDKVNEQERRFNPFFKPGWSPDLLLSCGYTNHLSVYDRALVTELGGFRDEYGPSQDHDMLLRVTERLAKDEIGHVPKVLYHWRSSAGSTAGDPLAKDGLVIQRAKAALVDAMRRRGIDAEVLDGLWPSSYRIKRRIVGRPLVSVIIPSRDNVRLLRPCVESVRSRTTYSNYEILIVDNDSQEVETLRYLRQLDATVIPHPGAFNFSGLNNLAVRQARGEYLLFLNDDTEVIAPEWMEALLEQAQRPEVGAVSGKLRYPDGSIQHAGVILGMSPDRVNGVSGHIFRGFRPGDRGYFGQIDVIRNFSAVTAAAMMTRRGVFEEVGGFDESLSVCYNDVDLCLKMGDRGYLIVYTPYAEMIHHESATRGIRVDIAEARIMHQRWGARLRSDPHYSPNLSLRTYDCSIHL